MLCGAPSPAITFAIRLSAAFDAPYNGPLSGNVLPGRRVVSPSGWRSDVPDETFTITPPPRSRMDAQKPSMSMSGAVTLTAKPFSH